MTQPTTPTYVPITPTKILNRTPGDLDPVEAARARATTARAVQPAGRAERRAAGLRSGDRQPRSGRGLAATALTFTAVGLGVTLLNVIGPLGLAAAAAGTAGAGLAGRAGVRRLRNRRGGPAARQPGGGLFNRLRGPRITNRAGGGGLPLPKPSARRTPLRNAGGSPGAGLRGGPLRRLATGGGLRTPGGPAARRTPGVLARAAHSALHRPAGASTRRPTVSQSVAALRNARRTGSPAAQRAAAVTRTATRAALHRAAAIAPALRRSVVRAAGAAASGTAAATRAVAATVNRTKASRRGKPVTVRRNLRHAALNSLAHRRLWKGLTQGAAAAILSLITGAWRLYTLPLKLASARVRRQRHFAAWWLRQQAIADAAEQSSSAHPAPGEQPPAEAEPAPADPDQQPDQAPPRPVYPTPKGNAYDTDVDSDWEAKPPVESRPNQNRYAERRSTVTTTDQLNYAPTLTQAALIETHSAMCQALPESIGNATDTLQAMADAFSEIAMAVLAQADAWVDQYPIAVIVHDTMTAFGDRLEQTGPIVLETKAAYERANAGDVGRWNDPRSNEEFWDVSGAPANQGQNMLPLVEQFKEAFLQVAAYRPENQQPLAAEAHLQGLLPTLMAMAEHISQSPMATVTEGFPGMGVESVQSMWHEIRARHVATAQAAGEAASAFATAHHDELEKHRNPHANQALTNVGGKR